MSTSSVPPSAGTDRPKRRGWLAIFGINSLLISILIHVLFGVVAACLIIEHFQKRHVNFHATEPPAPHAEVEHKVELVKRNSVESAPPDLKRITTTDVSSITLPDIPEVQQNDEVMPTTMSGVDGVMDSGTGNGMGSGLGAGAGAGDLNPFGSFTETSGQFTGIFYDFKQTPDKQPTKMSDGSPAAVSMWQQIVAKFAQVWDDSQFDKYFKSPKPIYADRFAISTRDSEEGPKAFALEKDVQPALWAIHYHAKVLAPAEGDYRFTGFGDDLMEVRIDGHLVLDAGWVSVATKTVLHQPLPNQWSPFYSHIGGSVDLPDCGPESGFLKRGSIFHVDTGQPVDMDVLIGDQGGRCAYYLMIEKIGNTYEVLPDGTPKFPFFQLGNKPAPTFLPNEEHPPYSTTPEPWQGVGN